MKEAVKIALIYIIICSLYILFSDKLVYDLFPSSKELTHIQTYKGISFVLLSGTLIFILIKRLLVRIGSINLDLKMAVSHHQMIFDKCPLPAFILDKKRLTYLRVNQAALLKFERNEEEYLRSTAADFIVGMDEEDLFQIRDKIEENGYLEVNISSRIRGGRIINQQLFCQNIIHERKEAIFVISLDITALRATEDVLMDKLITGVEEERRRIAREIHDGLKQYFGLAHGMLKSVKAGDMDLKILDRVTDLMGKGVEESRRLSHLITPQANQDFDLTESLNYLIENLNMLTDTKFVFNASMENEYKEDVKVNIYRIVQEASNNIKTHAKAGNASVDLFEKNNSLYLNIEDDGAGFDANVISKSLRSIGLSTMRTRVSKFDGILRLSSKPNGGTHIHVKIPLSEKVIRNDFKVLGNKKP